MGMGEHVGTRANDHLGDSAHRHLSRWVGGMLWLGGGDGDSWTCL